ncbi:hypothetical protein ACUNWD_00495 [Sunxiuqinia sp. A32]|uniref:hypothetical protein n=1 Tax=Sunxiuqinia sp. A32 TaxID=3461496 RepID=UPI0040465222
MNLKKYIRVVIAWIGILSIQAQNSISILKKGERAVFIGNSVTHGCHYHSFIWLYCMTRFFQ